MENKTLIIQLIQQEFKYFKLARGLERLSLEMYKGCYPENTEIVAALMGIEPKDITDVWSDIYMKYLDAFDEEGDLKDGEMLDRLAEECYGELVSLRDYC